MPDFEGHLTIKIQPTTRNLPISLTFEECSSATANDGSIPYGDSIASAVVYAYDPAGNDVTSDLVTQAAVVDGDTVGCEISYYSGISTGKHVLTCVLTMASGYVDEYDMRRVLVEDGITPTGDATLTTYAAHLAARDNPHVVTFEQLTTGLDTYGDNAAALAGGLTAGEVYRTATGALMVVYAP